MPYADAKKGRSRAPVSPPFTREQLLDLIAASRPGAYGRESTPGGGSRGRVASAPAGRGRAGAVELDGGVRPPA